ncbi:hypothetical protein KIN20_000566 [Parelaphostrongylus tenuis]|uniref:Uncharacterized protein n=1 Tax=Parelaphostrongylus tenuis TaxID=148309 RepID=A0AAD5QG57_PARTN|nr:hypothetical protein KIN20_000566 [Parelaphostrongylus tenuis]
MSAILIALILVAGLLFLYLQQKKNAPAGEELSQDGNKLATKEVMVVSFQTTQHHNHHPDLTTFTWFAASHPPFPAETKAETNTESAAPSEQAAKISEQPSSLAAKVAAPLEQGGPSPKPPASEEKTAVTAGPSEQAAPISEQSSSRAVKATAPLEQGNPSPKPPASKEKTAVTAGPSEQSTPVSERPSSQTLKISAPSEQTAPSPSDLSTKQTPAQNAPSGNTSQAPDAKTPKDEPPTPKTAKEKKEVIDVDVEVTA